MSPSKEGWIRSGTAVIPTGSARNHIVIEDFRQPVIGAVDLPSLPLKTDDVEQRRPKYLPTPADPVAHDHRWGLTAIMGPKMGPEFENAPVLNFEAM